jgi:hypothetical protein
MSEEKNEDKKKKKKQDTKEATESKEKFEGGEVDEPSKSGAKD